MNRVFRRQDIDEILEQSARDLLDRRGPGAIEWLNERIRQLQSPSEMRTLDLTYRVLSLVERQLHQAPPR